MNKTRIDWCDATWNPVTGCLHGCDYCYARKIAERFGSPTPDNDLHVLDAPVRRVWDEHGDETALSVGAVNPYPFGFAPTFHRYRLDEPARKTKPQTIFHGSMADIFGPWVPDWIIAEILDAARKAEQHRHLFLTKYPKRYETILDRYFPPNMWFGWSQDGPMGDELAFETHHAIKTFVSIEPLLRPFERFNIRGVDWAIVGAETGNRKGKVVPERTWIEDIAAACAEHGIPLFMKGSLKELMGEDFKQEFPWEVAV